MRKKLHCLPYCKFQPPVFVFGVPNPLFFGGFSPCVRLFRGGWDTYPTPEEKAAHRGDSGFYCFSQWWVVCVLQVCFQLQKQFLQAPQPFFVFAIRCAPATQQRQKIYFSCRLRLCHTFATEKEMLILPQAQQLFRFYHAYHTYFLQGFLCNEFRLVLVQTHQPLGFSVDPNGHGVLPGRGFDEIFLCQRFQ